MVFIGRSVREQWVRDLLEMLEREVIDAYEAAGRRRSELA